MTTAPAVERALALAIAGYAVFPARANKRPACEHGFKDASSDPAEVARLFSATRAPLVAVATGAVSGVAVLDLDGIEGLAWLAAHRAELPATVEVTTRRGGRHLWFALPVGLDVSSTASRIAPHVDTRGRGGYCVAWAPGELLDRSCLAPWPIWLSDMLRPPPPPPRPATPPRPTAGGSAYITAALRNELARVAGATEGCRNDTLNRAAFALGQFVAAGSLDPNDATRELLRAAIYAGLDEPEARATIRSGLAGGARKPREVGA